MESEEASIVSDEIEEAYHGDGERYDFSAEESEAIFIAWLKTNSKPKPPLRLPDLTKLVF